MNNTQITAIIIMIVILGIYLFFTSPWRDAKADAAAATRPPPESVARNRPVTRAPIPNEDRQGRHLWGLFERGQTPNHRASAVLESPHAPDWRWGA